MISLLLSEALFPSKSSNERIKDLVILFTPASIGTYIEKIDADIRIKRELSIGDETFILLLEQLRNTLALIYWVIKWFNSHLSDRECDALYLQLENYFRELFNIIHNFSEFIDIPNIEITRIQRINIPYLKSVLEQIIRFSGASTSLSAVLFRNSTNEILSPSEQQPE